MVKKEEHKIIVDKERIRNYEMGMNDAFTKIEALFFRHKTEEIKIHWFDNFGKKHIRFWIKDKTFDGLSFKDALQKAWDGKEGKA